MKKVIVFLADGFEEMEAMGTVDVLRRGGIEVKTISIMENSFVTGAHNVQIKADETLSDLDINALEADAVVLPGGMPGAKNLNENSVVKETVLSFYRENKLVAAICAAPMVLGGLGLLKNRKATCYPGFEDTLIGAATAGNPVETDGNVITGKGPGFVFQFALAIVAYLKGNDVAEEVAGGLLLQ